MKCPQPYHEYDYDEELSFKSLSGKTFFDVDLNEKVIYGSVFTVETPDTSVFREDTKGVKFIDCMMDNVIIPEGNEIIGGSNKRFKVQNDGNDWFIDEDNNPTKPIGYELFTKFKLEIPKAEDIPEQKVAEWIDLMEEAKKK